MSTVRTLEDIKKEYTQRLVQLGEASYKKRIAEHEENQLLAEVQKLNHEAASLKPAPAPVAVVEEVADETAQASS